MKITTHAGIAKIQISLCEFDSDGSLLSERIKDVICQAYYKGKYYPEVEYDKELKTITVTIKNDPPFYEKYGGAIILYLLRFDHEGW